MFASFLSPIFLLPHFSYPGKYPNQIVEHLSSNFAEGMVSINKQFSCIRTELGNENCTFGN